ncbi:ComEC/Rec2 family competence protein [Tunturiibacter empetritectus]|uniref:ComEC/Rec2 family competence protein n=1 Tax=Tunturiibacter empetritectus TaxID=3069691 RepID=UPI003D9AD9CC
MGQVDRHEPAPRVAQFRLMLRMGSEAIANMLGHWSRELLPAMIRCSLWALELSLIGVVAEMVMVLPMAVYFHRATMFAVPTNMLSVPLVAILAPTAVVTFCASLISPWLALLPGAMTALLLHGVKGVIGHVSAVHAADLRVPAPAWWVAILAVVAWAFCCWAVRRSRNWAWAAVVALPLVALIVLWPEHSIVTPGMMEVTAIDVGQGDSIFIVSPDGATMLIDAGGPVGGVTEAAEATSRFDVGEEVVSPYLWSRKFRRLDVLALSHAHSDHMGGMPAVLRNFRPREPVGQHRSELGCLPFAAGRGERSWSHRTPFLCRHPGCVGKNPDNDACARGRLRQPSRAHQQRFARDADAIRRRVRVVGRRC